MPLSQSLDSSLCYATYDTGTKKEEDMGAHSGFELLFAPKPEYCKAATNVLRKGSQRSLRLGDGNLAKYKPCTSAMIQKSIPRTVQIT